MSPTTQGRPVPVFATTQWTRVLQARGDSPDARAALSALCESYYAPVHAFVRLTVRHDEAARDLTQEFFTRLLAGRGFEAVDPERGRFRSFLLGAVKNFLADMHDRERAAKRGGGQAPEPLDPGTDTTPGLDPADPQAPPDELFDRHWACTVLDRALSALGQEFTQAEAQAHFEVLKPWLTGDTEGLVQAEAAARLGMNANAVKVAIHRLRRRYRELVKAEIAATVSDPALVHEELNHLRAAFG